MSKNKKKPQPKAPPLSRRLLEGLRQAENLLDQHKPAEASQLLEELAARHPQNPDVLTLQVNASYDLQDYNTYEWAAYRLSQLKRNLPDIFIGLSGAYLQMHRPALALRSFEQFLQRWPAHPRGAEIRQTVDELRTLLLAEVRQPGLSESETLELAAGHDEVRFLILHNQLRQGKQLAEKLLGTHPGLVPVMNNLTQMHLMEGNQAEARRLSQAVLEIDPENIHALAQMARILFLAGDFAGARVMAQRLENSPSQAVERWARLAETYSLLDENQRLVDLYERAEQAGALDSSPESALALHHAAAAFARLGNETTARELLERALKILPNFNNARKNLDDLNQPAGQRNGPPSHPITFWLSRLDIEDIIRSLRAPVQSKNEAAIEDTARKMLQKYPELRYHLPDILARGDDGARRYAIQFIKIAESSELLSMLKDFVLSDRGTDELRQETMRYLLRKGHLPAGSYRMWFGGEWKDLLQLNFEITEVHTPEFQSREAEKLAAHALQALRNRDGAHAQELLQQALAIEETPSLFNNLALALEMQGQTQKAHAIAESIHARFPDYFFGIIAAANQATLNGDLEKAAELLKPLIMRPKMHLTEFDALCEAQIRLALARKDNEVARSWLRMWEQVKPDDPRVADYKLALSAPTWLEKMRKSLKK